MDIYFEKEYAKLYETDKEKVEIFEYSNENGKGRNIFLKREIPLKINNQIYYDIITPYGYGGPIFETKEDINKQKFIDEYCEKFNEYCEKNNIVSEFVRFHPLEKNYENLEKFYQITYISDTIFMDLSSEEEILKNMSSKARNKLRKGIKNSLVFEEDEKISYLEEFKKLYYETMDKNSASNSYYFDDSYFQNFCELKDKIKLFVVKDTEQNILTASLIMLKDKNMHYHLTANSAIGYKYAANNFLLYNLAIWGNKNGYEKLHLGGGFGGNDSPLYEFKKSMNEKGILKFCIGKKIYNKEIYDELVKQRNLTEKEKESSYFPLYRI